MKKIIALALVLVMLFALCACGKEEAPAATEAPEVVATEAPAEATAEPTPEPTPEPAPVGIEPDSGMHTFKSDAGISFEFDSKYVAMQNPVGNVTVFAGTEAEIPFCTVALVADTTAEAYIAELSAATEIEHAEDIVIAAGEPTTVTVGEKELSYIYYTYNDAELNAVVACAYYAETLESGETVVYSFTALEEDTAVVESIINHAIETFELVK